MALTLYVRFIDNDEKAKELKLISKGVYEQVCLDSEYVVIKNSNGTELFLDKSSFKCAKKQEYSQFKSHLKNLEKIEKSGLEKVEIKKRWHSKKKLYKCPKCNTTFFATARSLYKSPICRNCMTGKSFGEEAIIKILVSNNIKFIKEKKFSGLKGLNQGQLRFDFLIYSPNNSSFLLEVDGEQHNISSNWGGNTSEHDIIKNNYCVEKGIKLYRIKYNFGKLGSLENSLKAILFEEGFIQFSDFAKASAKRMLVDNSKIIKKEISIENKVKVSKENKKFYAIKNGRKCNVIVNTWNECNSLVSGVSNPKFKKFTTYEEALNFLKQE